MTLDEFTGSVTQHEPPAGLSRELTALWYDGKGNWEQAHEMAQIANTPSHCLIHAYLHRKEGDTGNARYWYTRAGRKMPHGSLSDEWEVIVREMLGK